MDTTTENTNEVTPIQRAHAPRSQTTIPGTERKHIPEVEAAALEYRNARDHRMELTKIEVAKKAALIAVLQKFGITVYKFDDDENEEVTVELREKTSVKVRKSSSAADDGEDE